LTAVVSSSHARLLSRNAVAGFAALLTSFAMMMTVSTETAQLDTLTELAGALSLIFGLPFVVAYAIGETSTRR
jgi:hypothetical protein